MIFYIIENLLFYLDSNLFNKAAKEIFNLMYSGI